MKDKLVEHVKNQIDKLAQVEITCDYSTLPPNDKKALGLIVEAARLMDRIYLRQVFKDNETLAGELKTKSSENEKYNIVEEYFTINFGPFDRLDNHRPFLPAIKKKPAGANYYPEDMSKEEFETHLHHHPEDEEAFTSNFTLIRRQEGGSSGKLTAIPYSDAYREFLEPAAKKLEEAAGLTPNQSLSRYLQSRAKAFLSNDYYQSDLDWMDLTDHDLEVVIGPYEVYEDELFGYKAAFEAFITLVDREESKKLAEVGRYLDEMENHLPIDDRYKNLSRGKSSPVMVVNEIFSAGDTKAGVQTTAFNLPNDERVREAKGSKKVMLKNVAHAKFEHCWIPIAKEVLTAAEFDRISFDAYFNHVLMHEVSHGLGPGIIEIKGRQTTVNKELKELYATIEEAKADILGLWNVLFMIEKGVFPAGIEQNVFSTYLGGIFRSVRFGIQAAHGGANAIQMNFLLEKQGFLFHSEEVRFSVNHKHIKEGVKQLAKEILEIEALGDYHRAQGFINKYRVLSAPLTQAIEKVMHVPVDIRPVYKV